MNRTGLRLLVYFLFLSLLASRSLWAGQVITEDIRQWARETVAQERALETIQATNTVSVLYFQNKSGRDNLNPLQKGIAVMLMTDLAKVKELTVVERVRLEALVQELKLGMSGMVDSDSAPRLGQFLGAEYLVGGSISLVQGINEFAINSLRLNVPEEKIDGRAETRGELLTKIFEMEKDLLFKIIAHFNIQLTYEEKVELQKIPTESLLALMNLFQGMESSDTGDYLEATRLYQEALSEDPEFELAGIFLEELRDRGLWDGVEKKVEAYSEPEPESESEEWFQKVDNPRKDNEDPNDREIDNEDPNDQEIDADGDGYMISQGDCDDHNPGIHPGADDRNCNGIDEDCDGQADEGYTDKPTNCGTGACQSTGMMTCQNGVEVDTCAAGTPVDDDRNCDGIDGNCDGQADEGYTDKPTNCGTGACQSTGMMTCQNGYEVDTCVAGNPVDDDRNCDGIDGDCDGQVDEGYTEMPTICGIGACQSTGMMTCQNGYEVDTCVAGTPAAADLICDGIDEDCDGQVDEDCAYAPPLVDASSLQMASDNMKNDPELAARVDSGDFQPGNIAEAENQWGYAWDGAYEPGLQTIGRDENDDGIPDLFLDPDIMTEINDNPFLAYAVQVEEDRLNKRSLELLQTQADLLDNADLVDDVMDVLNATEIRTRDDFFMQRADAQAGRVLRDRSGNWVRIQQYVLRPDDQTVQVLNVNLREEGVHAGLSTIDFTTRFTKDLPPGSLTHIFRNILFDTYVDEGGGRSISNPTNKYELDWMSVRLTNPGGDFFQESRTFGTLENTGGDLRSISAQQWYLQPIIDEQLLINLNNNPQSYSYAPDTNNVQAGEYCVKPNSTSFAYMSAGGPLLTAEFYVVGDATNANNTGVIRGYDETISDIWDALAINLMKVPHIGNNNLEMVFRDGGGAEIIDVVYIPMSRMWWKQ